MDGGGRGGRGVEELRSRCCCGSASNPFHTALDVRLRGELSSSQAVKLSSPQALKPSSP